MEPITTRISETGYEPPVSNPSPRCEVLATEGVQSTWSNLLGLVEIGSSRDEIRTALDALESELLKMPQADHGLDHLFSDGLYIRVASIQAGTLFTTPAYAEECILTMLRGRLLIVTDEGAQAVHSPDFALTKVGTKRAIFAMDDVLAHTVHPNPANETDIQKLEARIYGKEKP